VRAAEALRGATPSGATVSGATEPGRYVGSLD
jgi:hypothetical protein